MSIIVNIAKCIGNRAAGRFFNFELRAWNSDKIDVPIKACGIFPTSKKNYSLRCYPYLATRLKVRKSLSVFLESSDVKKYNFFKKKFTDTPDRIVNFLKAGNEIRSSDTHGPNSNRIIPLRHVFLATSHHMWVYYYGQLTKRSFDKYQ